MIVDTSAILAIMLKEPEEDRLTLALAGADSAGIGAPTLAEAAIVLGFRVGFEKRGLLQRVLQEFGISVIPFGDVHWAEAVDAYERFGKGRHKAALNFGDCMSYATARLARQPLLFVGDDFSRTDIDVAAY